MSTDLGYGGIVNMGLTCYANAVLQCLRHCSKIPWIFEEGRYNTLFQGTAKPERAAKQALTKGFAEVTQMLGRCKQGQSVRPGDFWLKLQPCVRDTCFEHFAMKAPHDSHEFFLFLLDVLHESLAQEVDMNILRKPTSEKEKRTIQALEVWKREFSPTYSPLVDLFYGLMHVRVQCQTCSNTTHRWETFTTLKAAVPQAASEPPTLQSMITEELKPEMIDGYDCEKCAAKTTAKKSLSLWRMPQVMVVVLKRFSPNGRKIHTRIAPVGITDFTSYFSDESPEQAKEYALRGVVDHHGGAGGGHYTAQCKHLATDAWILYDDEGVRQMPAPAFGESTYMLFFERKRV